MMKDSKNYLLVFIGAILFGTITVGGQFFINLGLSAYEISLYSMFFSALILSLFVIIKPKYRLNKKMFLFFLIYGFISAFQEITQFGALILGVPVAIVVILLYCQPIWTIGFARFMLKEKITLKKIIAIILAIIGILILVKPWEAKATGSLLGIIFAIFGGICISLWLILGKKSQNLHKQHYITTVFGYLLFTFITLLILWPILNLFIKDQSLMGLSIDFPPVNWVYLVIFAIISGVIPGLLFYKGVGKIPASVAGIILLMEPIIASILASILFNQPITINIIIGGILILTANYLVIYEK